MVLLDGMKPMADWLYRHHQFVAVICFPFSLLHYQKASAFGLHLAPATR
jgi:hypothetical protein